MSQPSAHPWTLHLEVRFADGFVALSTFEGEPLRFVPGDGTVPAGLESLIQDLEAGSEGTFLLDGSEFFGPYDPDKLHWMELDELGATPGPKPDPTPGQLLAFETPGGHETAGLILEREADRVRVDFNHPFAGRALTLRMLLLARGPSPGPSPGHSPG